MATLTTIPSELTNDATWQQHLEDELEIYLERLIEHFDPEKVILFGSLAAGQAHLWSDIDLVVIAESEKRYLDRIKDALLLLRPRVGLDILIYTPKEFEALGQKRPYFQQEILKGRCLYERGK